MNLTYRYRVKSNLGLLNRQARAVSYCWNYLNETQKSCLRLGKRWPSAFDLINLTGGTSKELGISADTISQLCQVYVSSRGKRPFLRFRGRRSLGWVPIKGAVLKVDGSGFKFFGKHYRVFNSRSIPEGAKICDRSSFSQDSR